MSTFQDFENAPVGATAKKEVGLVAIREGDETDHHPWMCTTYGHWFSNEELVERGYALVPPVPTTAREALDLAWELAHPVKEGQVIPEGMKYLERHNFEIKEYSLPCIFRISPEFVPKVRTFDPLPDPEPDWLDAPAVLAACRYSDATREGVFTPSGVHPDRWVLAGTVGAMHWSELRDVTPLYPEGEKE